jgi:choline-sulfatase
LKFPDRRYAVVWLAYMALAGVRAGAQPATGSMPDVYLVTIDTLRADHVHCYGDQQIQTPALDSIAADGIRFTQAFTPSPITISAHTSILTGLLPSVHGVTDFGIPLATTIPTWAALLQQDGYQTAAFIGAVVLDAHTLAPGLDRGFDYYDNFPTDVEASKHWDRVERRGAEVVRHAESWMDAHPGKPRFVWVHLYDPHDPYEPPPPFAQQYKDHLYDGEIAYADDALGHLLQYLKRGNRYRNALIIVVGDHGEGLGEHGEQTHGIFLYDATTHVPLLIKLPGDAPAAKVVTEQVPTTDILPTVLDLLRIPPPAALAQRSLRAYFAGASEPDRVAFAETDYPLRFGWAPLRAVRSNGFQFIEAPKPELYDLGNDPRELKNQYEAGNRVAQHLRTELVSSGMRQIPELGSLTDPKDKIDEQNLIHAAMMAADEGRPQEAQTSLQKVLALDPNSPTALQQLGELAFKAGDYRHAVEYFSRMRKVHPADLSEAVPEAKAMDKLGDTQAARSLLEQAVTASPGLLDARVLLADLEMKTGQKAAAEDQLQAVLLLQPAEHDALLALARKQLQEKRFGEVVELLASQVDGTPGDEDLAQLLIQAYVALGRTADANKVRGSQPSH